MSNNNEEPMDSAEAFAYEVKRLHEALKAEGFNSNWAGDFIKAFFTGAARK